VGGGGGGGKTIIFLMCEPLSNGGGCRRGYVGAVATAGSGSSHAFVRNHNTYIPLPHNLHKIPSTQK